MIPKSTNPNDFNFTTNSVRAQHNTYATGKRQISYKGENPCPTVAKHSMRQNEQTREHRGFVNPTTGLMTGSLVPHRWLRRGKKGGN